MPTEQRSVDFDAVVIGGSYAGLSASMQLGRARRRVLVIDAGVRRNRFASSSHGFLGQDGRPPAAIVDDARAQVLAYPTVRLLDASATRAVKADHGFEITVDTDETFVASRVVLATGVIDELPAVDGLAERWGKSVFHCPYCHGYELNSGRIGVLAVGPHSFHHAMMLPDWGQVTFFTNGAFTPDEAQHAALSKRGVAIEPERVVRIVDAATIVLADGRVVPLDGMFTATRTSVASPIAEQLACAFDESPFGSFIRTDAMKATTVAGVFACGDAARAAGNVAMAVGDGAQAGFAAHQSLIFGS
jgi:thioredoxin reductase